MSKTRIFSVVGARPQFVKAAIVSQALEKYPDVEHAIVHTGQHYDQNMSDVFFEELGMPAPAFNLHISASGHGAMTGRMLEALEKLYIDEKPDVIVVYGDTNSTLAGALAAAKIHLPLAHVEAGLRSFNRMPEEINRVLTDHITDVHFSVTDVSTANLLREGISGPRVEALGFKPKSPNFKIVDPIGYIDIVRLERAAAVIVTDSGGVQREAFFHKVPCVTFRDETEWTELVDSGWNVLAPLDDPEKFKDICLSRVGTRGTPKEHYGNGDAGEKIAATLVKMPQMTFKR